MKLVALVGASLLAAGMMTGAPASAQSYGHRYPHAYGHRTGHGYGYRRAYGYRHRHYYPRGGWRHHYRYDRCRYRRCW